MSTEIVDNWYSYFTPRRFFGREQELRLLEQELLQRESKAVCILGTRGTGKTSLAMAFANSHRNAFPAGADYHVYASSFESLAQSVASHVSNASSPYLLTIDEIERRPVGMVGEEVLEIRRLRPSARLILISEHELPSVGLDYTIHLGGLDKASFTNLLQSILARETNFAASEELFDLIAGNPLSLAQVSDLILSKSVSLREAIQRLHNFSQAGILGPDGRPISHGSPTDQRIVVDIATTNDELIRRLSQNPKLVYELSSRRFEEIVAELLDRLGYTVTLTPASKDGGKDIYAARKDHLGSFLYLVECKKYAPDRPIGVGLIRQLNGVLQADRATAGILATTSYFTRGAKEFQQQTAHRISLKDYLGLQEWISEANQPKHL